MWSCGTFYGDCIQPTTRVRIICACISTQIEVIYTCGAVMISVYCSVNHNTQRNNSIREDDAKGKRIENGQQSVVIRIVRAHGLIREGS